MLVPGSTAVVIGAGGGLGHLAVQILAAVSPARIVAVDERPAGLDLARGVGAHETVAVGDTAAAEIIELSHGGAQAVFDFVGADATLALAAQVGRPLGRVYIVGLGGGTLPVSFFSVPYEASFATTYWGSLPELVEVIALARSGAISATVHRYPLERAGEAYADLRAGRLEGRAVVVPNG